MRQFKVNSYSDKTEYLHCNPKYLGGNTRKMTQNLLICKVCLPEPAQRWALSDCSHPQVFGTEWMQFLGIISTGSFHLFSAAGIVSVLWISQWEAEFKRSCFNEVLLLAMCSFKGWDFSSHVAIISSCFPGGSLLALPGCRHKRIAPCCNLRVEEQK